MRKEITVKCEGKPTVYEDYFDTLEEVKKFLGGC